MKQSELRRLSKGDRTALFVCTVGAFLFLADALLPGTTLIPTGFLASTPPWASLLTSPDDPARQYDLLFQFYPWADYFRSAFEGNGSLLWNPFGYFGSPFLANPQTALFYPLTWWHLLLAPPLSFTLLFISKLALSSSGTYLFLRDFHLGPFSALSGALLFTYSTYNLASLPFPYASVNLLLPWLLWSGFRLVQSHRPGSFLVFVALASIVVFAGQPQSGLVLFFALGLSLLIRFTIRRTVRSLGVWVWAALALAAAISSVQWLPSLAYVQESMVTAGPRIVKSGYPYAFENLINLVLPDFFGTPVHGSFWGFPGYHDSALYTTSLALLLIPFSLLILRSRSSHASEAAVPEKRRKELLFISLLFGGVSLGLLFGVPLLESLLDLPGFELIRRSRFVVLLLFGLCGLLALGFDMVTGHDFSLRSRLSVSFLAFCLLLTASAWALYHFSDYLEGLRLTDHTFLLIARTFLFLAAGSLLLLFLRGRRLALFLLLLLAGELLFLNAPLLPRGSAATLYPRSELLDTLRDRRIFAFGNTLTPNSATLYEIRDLRAYDVMTPRRLFEYMRAVDSSLGDAYSWLVDLDDQSIHAQTRLRRIVMENVRRYGEELRTYLQSSAYWSVGIRRIENEKLFRALQIEYLLQNRQSAPKPFEARGSFDSLHLFFNDQAKTARLFTDWREVAPAQALRELTEGDPEKTAYIETDLSSPPPSSPVPGRGSEIRILEENPGEMVLEVTTPKEAILVLSRRYSKGWQSRLDQEAWREVFPAQYLFQGVFVPAGDHQVSLRYAPPAWIYGLLLSLVGTVASLITAIFLARTGRPRRGQKSKRGARVSTSYPAKRSPHEKPN